MPKNLTMNQLSISGILKSMPIIYFALIAGQLLMAGVILYLSSTSGIEANPENLKTLRMFIPVVSLTTVAISYLLYNKRREQGAALEDLGSKTNHYRVSNILRWAIIESGNLFALVAIFLTGSSFFFLFFALGMAVFIIYRPSIGGFVQDYSLNSKEEQTLRSAI